MELTKNELTEFVRSQKKIFDLVRLVDVSMCTQLLVSDDGVLQEQPYRCYATWKKNSRCENCTSAKAFAHKSKMTKFEFVNNNVFFVVSAYSEVEGVPFVIEMVSELNDETLFEAYGKDKFIRTIEAHNKKLYTDQLTGAYNRRYFEEQLRKLNKINAVAMVDVDNFKSINDTFGHSAGDFALKEIVRTISASIRSFDAVIRLGGDEFLTVFQKVERNELKEILDKIRNNISMIHSDEYADMCLSVSIGAVYSDESAVELINQADKYLYEAKKLKNCVIVEEIPDKLTIN